MRKEPGSLIGRRIAYRQKVCPANGDLEAEGGSLARVISADCYLSMTAQRAVELEQLAPH